MQLLCTDCLPNIRHLKLSLETADLHLVATLAQGIVAESVECGPRWREMGGFDSWSSEINDLKKCILVAPYSDALHY